MNTDKQNNLLNNYLNNLKKKELTQETKEASKALAEKRQSRELGTGGETTQPRAKARVAAANLNTLPSSSTDPRGSRQPSQRSRQPRQRESSQPPEITGNEDDIPERKARSRSPPKNYNQVEWAYKG